MSDACLPPNQPPMIPYHAVDPGLPSDAAARRFYEFMKQRRNVRMFSDRPVPFETIEWIIRAAGSAPSGANKQPWRFVVVGDSGVKKQIREAAEAEEREFYHRRATPQWLKDLAPLGTDDNKGYLEVAPWLIVMFRLAKDDPDEHGEHGQVYYPVESAGIAAGFLLAAVHHAGLVALTHTPSPMGFLSKLLARPDHERPFLLIPVGYPAENCVVPDITRKPLDKIMVRI